MMKLGIPIPSQVNTVDSDCLTVDFFDELSVQLGDNQNVAKGESTLMAKLNAMSSLIQGRNESEHRTSLVLLDELGGDTDPAAGRCEVACVISGHFTDCAHFASLRVCFVPGNFGELDRQTK